VQVRALSNGTLAAIALAVVACDPPPSVTGPHAAIARIHRAHCGECHTRVDPGARTRAQLQAAFPRHHKRVHLSDAEWAELLDYLAAYPPPGDAVTK
jgi:hypothetical protein